MFCESKPGFGLLKQPCEPCLVKEAALPLSVRGADVATAAPA